MLRVGIRAQLSLLVTLTALVAVGVLAIVTWIINHRMIVELRTSRLSLTTDLKAAQLTQSLVILHNSVSSISTRLILQNALRRWHTGNNTAENWQRAIEDLEIVTGSNGGGFGGLLQAVVYDPRLGNGNDTPGGLNILGGRLGLMNVTGENARGIIVPALKENGWNTGYLGNTTDFDGVTSTSARIQAGEVLHDGFPDCLYPTAADNDLDRVVDRGGMVMGPLQVNSSFFMMSFTNPIINNTSKGDLLGFLTVVVNAQLVFDVVKDTRGLGDTGQVILVGPGSPNNLLSPREEALVKLQGRHPRNATIDPEKMTFRYLFPPKLSKHLGGSTNTWSSFPAVKKAFIEGFQLPFPKIPKPFDQIGFSMLEVNEEKIRSAGRMEKTVNAEGQRVSAGYIMPSFDLVNWVLICEQTQWEVFKPIVKLRNIMLATVFATFVVVVLLVFPLAHFAVRPIVKLKDATAKTTQPPSYYRGSEDDSRAPSIAGKPAHDDRDNTERGIKILGFNLRRRHNKAAQPVFMQDQDSRRRVFRIPGRVEVGKMYFKDELTDLTATYNEMTDELARQYEHLEDRVAERTKELEEQTKLAEAANEAKGLFVANISHELRTPLNGILGMAAVCMGEDDLGKIKDSLSVVYRSGELLYNLLTDLLNFSKNQFGRHQLTLDAGEFRMLEIVTQIRSIFGKQARDHNQDFTILIDPGDEIMDMVLWGDSNRILQVLINLVGNGLKFTPEGGSVELRINLRGETEITKSITSSTALDRLQWSAAHSQTASKASLKPAVNPKEHSPTSTPSPTMVNGQAASTEASSANTETVENENAVAGTDEDPPQQTLKTLLFEFAVEDTGPGIPEHLQKRVFEPFVQGDLRLSKRYGGTGLGLSICAQLTKLMHGTINLKSLEQTGSTFTVQLPLGFVRNGASNMLASEFAELLLPITSHQAMSHTAVSPTNSKKNRAHLAASHDGTNSKERPTNGANFGRTNKPVLPALDRPYYTPSGPLQSMPANEGSDIDYNTPGGDTINSTGSASTIIATPGEYIGMESLRVLVAEDNMVNQEVVSRMLKLEHIIDITFAKDGREAVDCVKEALEQRRNFNLVLMDIQMPNVDGLEATQIIRKLGYTAPIVALTAFAEDSNVKECREAGMNSFLAKPIKRTELRKVLVEYCRHLPMEEVDKEKARLGAIDGKKEMQEKNASPVAAGPPSKNDHSK
ncbi:histidine kinase-group VI protein [Tirmania nivea]|nr:histidine kinase-group VI protein [Tirmania nivea]